MEYLTRQEELILLAVYHLRKNAYLVTIRRYLKESTDRNWTIGAVYVPLERLKKKAYLEAYIGDATTKRGRNEIKYYKLTQDGLNALQDSKKVQEIMWSSFSEAEYKI